MKAQNITIDINKLESEDLELLAQILYNTERSNVQKAKAVQNRLAFVKGWMSEKQEDEYIKEFC
ncbi:hypothetical protein D1155_10095 [Anaerotruncus sp. 80]|uniref:Uncharacterized protein n=1 Tax=Anaerotruncus colihominis TaxID=169435 RepID=A0A845QJD9_9FIRM|nr:MULTISPECIES: hypothetical protein [Anaerotruncus]NBH61999.1 hypothetical protein [Anaerotruncus colihominis]NCF02654.1 hypothetical protein [Anaerotruncus sp. 80]